MKKVTFLILFLTHFFVLLYKVDFNPINSFNKVVILYCNSFVHIKFQNNG
jgi:hypothetical protein